MDRILILGSTGMLGQALCREARKRNLEVVGVARKESDICADICDGELLKEVILRVKPKVIINTVAITDLLLCEKDPGYAYIVNSRPAAIIAKICKELSAYYIHISTDHYFYGDEDQKHTENCKIFLVNEYARTKFAAEGFAMTYEQSLIVRTNIVGFRGIAEKPTFAEWVIQTLKSKSPMTLFNDFYTSSITVTDFSRILFDLLKIQPIGLLNVGSRDVVSKKEFIYRVAKKLGCFMEKSQTGSVNSNSSLIRANSLGLDVSKVEFLLNYLMPTTDEVIEQLICDYQRRIDK